MKENLVRENLIDPKLKEAGWIFGLDIKTEDHLKSEGGLRRTDYTLRNEKKEPFCVVEAKPDHENPLNGKEQARAYAKHLKCDWIILTNGITHYLWNLKYGNPTQIQKFPTIDELYEKSIDLKIKNNYSNIEGFKIDNEIIISSQYPNYKKDPKWIYEREKFLRDRNLFPLRNYQVDATECYKSGLLANKKNFLFELATGTGKTMLAASMIKMSHMTSISRRTLYIIDRLDLENQTSRELNKFLSKDYQICILKESENDFKTKEIVITTIQTLLSNDRYKTFNRDYFDLVIGDEVHRLFNGEYRKILDYFKGIKVGFTATPKDYLSNPPNDIPEIELAKRQLLDTYHTFGCEKNEPTFRYSLEDGIRDGFLTGPICFGVETEILSKLNSDEGYDAIRVDHDGQIIKQNFKNSDFEKKYNSESTNQLMCELFLQNAKKDPISDEIGKTIIYCTSQEHASKITQFINEQIDLLYPNKYNSDFAVQITSDVRRSSELTTKFANNSLNGSGNFIEDYPTSKTRIVVTVDMMTTGYDCPDILNVVLMRKVSSPTDFIQMRGRGTRRCTFKKKGGKSSFPKEGFYFFDFFGNFKIHNQECDKDLSLPKTSQKNTPGEPDEKEIFIDSYNDCLKEIKIENYPNVEPVINEISSEQEFVRFCEEHNPPQEIFKDLKDYFDIYLQDNEFRTLVKKKKYGQLRTIPNGFIWKKVNQEWRTKVSNYIEQKYTIT